LPFTEADMDAWFFAVVRTRGYAKGRYFRVRDFYRAADRRDADLMLMLGMESPLPWWLGRILQPPRRYRVAIRAWQGVSPEDVARCFEPGAL
jgi:hypothetical protein